MNLVLRLLKRKTSLTLPISDLIDTEFSRGGSFEPSLSVFELQDEEPFVTQARAEYDATYLNPKTDEDRLGLSFHGIDGLDIDESPGKTAFAFTKSAHRTLEFVEEEELVAAVEAALAELQSRLRTVTPDAIKAYVADKLLAKDKEWVDLCEEKKRWRNWALGTSKPPGPPGGIRVIHESIGREDQPAVGAQMSLPANSADGRFGK